MVVHSAGERGREAWFAPNAKCKPVARAVDRAGTEVCPTEAANEPRGAHPRRSTRLSTFFGRISAETVSELVGRFGAKPEPAMDAACRFPLRDCDAWVTLLHGDGTEAKYQIEIVDVSLNGFGFRTPTAFGHGQMITVEVPIPGLDSQVWHACIASIHARAGSCHHLGARFESPDRVPNVWRSPPTQSVPDRPGGGAESRLDTTDP